MSPKTNRDQITVRCSNGHRLAAPGSFLGRIVRCPKCKDPVEIQRQEVIRELQRIPAARKQTPKPGKTPGNWWNRFRQHIRTKAITTDLIATRPDLETALDDTQLHRWSLDRVVFELGDTPFDFRTLNTGTFVLGHTGGGKTKIRDFYLNALLPLEVGVFAPCVKVTDGDEIDQAAKRHGLGDRVVRFGMGRMHYFDFLNEELARYRGCSGFTLNLVELLVALAKVNRKNQNEGGDPIWDEKLKELLTAAIDLCIIATGKVTLEDIKAVIRTAPVGDEVHSEKWQATSRCHELLTIAFEKTKDEIEAHDFDDVANFFLVSPKPTAFGRATLIGSADPA